MIQMEISVIYCDSTGSQAICCGHSILANQSSLHQLLGANGSVRFPSKVRVEVDHDLLNEAIEHTLVTPRTLSDPPDSLVDLLEVEQRSRFSGEKTKLKPRLFRTATIHGTLSDLIYLIRHENRYAAENMDILLLIEAEIEIMELVQAEGHQDPDNRNRQVAHA
jgi:hypothetical protein